MAGSITNKQFSTLETLQRLLRYREVMFKTIEFADINHAGAIPETVFYSFVIALKDQLSDEQANEVSLVFDVDNLLQSRIINDRRNVDGVTKLLFNTSVFEVFRLCRVSLYRPLTKVSLNAAMTPLWSLMRQVKRGKLSTTPGTDDYLEWVDDLIYRVSDLLGKIRANIAKLQNVGVEFEKSAIADPQGYSQLEVKRESYNMAAKLYQREIDPLKVFLDKHTRYEEGDGIFLTLGYFRSFFQTINDTSRAYLMLSYEVQYLDLFSPIKQVANQVSIYLQKTQQSLHEHSAIDRAYSVVLAAFENTLGGDLRNKFIDMSDLKSLGVSVQCPALGRIAPFRTEKSPSFLDVAFNELATRVQSYAPENSEKVLLSESISKEAAKKLQYSQRLARWVDNFDWPLNKDFLALAHKELSQEWPDFKLPDLFEVQSRLINSPNYQLELRNEYQKMVDDVYELQYRVRHLVSLSNQQTEVK
ncbi:hypothetical protein [Pseudoalteromonas luteoviolacea]|uniref:Uncharacterized protein n=1 Tax=Pseudoalteromonas luteoviolacea DSM 6061 TaxID=1365250 RepID=A0A166YHQ9_9GAMM|nr:hypothetical protein [Pseudoalteromonas luteoviolacea]KZN42643.1 hypothetical protein N475_09950 [Pseudoalteromonas luteoviolacea DSM 6061]MBE0385162.1 hypothetical protein [Pseudoalteromonas luteoviolacea DSM 6061]